MYLYSSRIKYMLRKRQAAWKKAGWERRVRIGTCAICRHLVMHHQAPRTKGQKEYITITRPEVATCPEVATWPFLPISLRTMSKGYRYTEANAKKPKGRPIDAAPLSTKTPVASCPPIIQVTFEPNCGHFFRSCQNFKKTNVKRGQCQIGF